MKKILLLIILFFSHLSASPKAVVFDFGGVMVGESHKEKIVSFLCKSLDISPAEFEKVNHQKRKAVEMGESAEEFWFQFAKERGISLPENWKQNYEAVMKEALGINEDMYALVARLKDKKVQVALLSNIDTQHAKLVRQLGLYAPFEPCLLSCEIGVEKPDPRAYEILLKQLHCSSGEVVFVDDKSENVEAARDLGIDAMVFTTTEQIQKELEKRNIF